MEWIVGAVAAALVAVVVDRATNGVITLQLNRLFRRLDWGPASRLTITTRLRDGSDGWYHLEVANVGLRWPEPLVLDAREVRATVLIEGEADEWPLTWGTHKGPQLEATVSHRDPPLTLTLLRRPRANVNDYAPFNAGVCYLADAQALTQRNPRVLAPRLYTFAVTLRPLGDDEIMKHFQVDIPNDSMQPITIRPS